MPTMALHTADQLDALAQKLSDAARDLRAGSLDAPITIDPARREKLTAAALEAVDALNPPFIRAMSMLSGVSSVMALKLFLDWKVLEKIPTGEETGIAYADLAEQANADVNLICTLLSC